MFTRGAARRVAAGGLPLQADCLCSFWRPAAFNRHQFRQEKHNRHARVFSHCKYFLSCQLPSLPARARSLAFSHFPPSPAPSKLSSWTLCKLVAPEVFSICTLSRCTCTSLLAKSNSRKKKHTSVNAANKQPGPLYCKPVSNGQARVRVSACLNPEYLLPYSPLQASLLSYLLLLS